MKRSILAPTSMLDSLDQMDVYRFHALAGNHNDGVRVNDDSTVTFNFESDLRTYGLPELEVLELEFDPDDLIIQLNEVTHEAFYKDGNLIKIVSHREATSLDLLRLKEVLGNDFLRNNLE